VTAAAPAPAPATEPGPAGTPHCPQCDGELAPGQDWCLRCGRGATTRVLPPRHWRIPLALACALAALAGVAVAVLFVALSGDDQRVVTSGQLTRTITVTTQSPAAATSAPVPTSPTVPAVPTATTGSTPRATTGSTTGSTAAPGATTSSPSKTSTTPPRTTPPARGNEG
jgi:hypothetical protein